MRIVFMGTPDIARKCLQRLYEDGHEIVGVYTKQDMPKNRGMKLQFSEVKQYALSVGLPVYQPTRWKSDKTYETLRALEPELIVVVAYGRILPQRVLDIPAKGSINLHASLLPKLRGAAPVQWAVLHGLEKTGVSVQYMSAEMDAGNIIDVLETPIGTDETSGELMERLGDIGAPFLSDVVRRIADAETPRLLSTGQNEAEATIAPMITKEMAVIDWTKNAAEIHNHVCGMAPQPGASTVLDGKRFKIFRVEQSNQTSSCDPGTVIGTTKRGLQIACGSGEVITVRELQAEGGKRMEATAYLRGHPITISAEN